ncbi:MAG: L-serine ammonia-lyase, iron-sulfur-dependent, subunit beta [Firmicutes bacterium]|nr:L-serine ammonia-lyase, iron-sulfur-dependent, subunit beta [Bacillota bacterium]
MTSVFDIIGPIMIGPSSSHTAGAARLGMVARTLLQDKPVDTQIKLHGSFARTYKGHGTDKALIGGLLGFAPDDLRIRDSLQIAATQGLAFCFEPTDLGDVHPNTALINLQGQSGKSISLLGSSIGGGKVRIHEVNGLPAEFTAEYDTLIVYHKDTPGVISEVTSLLAMHSINIGQMKVFRSHRGGRSVIVLETDEPICGSLCQRIQAVPNVTGAMALPAI